MSAFLTEVELAERWRVHRATVARLRAVGRLAFHRISERRVVYAIEDVERYEHEQMRRERVVGLSSRGTAVRREGHGA